MNILREKFKAQGWHACCSSAPNTDGMNAAALAQANLSKEQLDWVKQIYEQTAPDRAAATQRANTVSDAQLAQMKTQTAIAQDYADYNKSTFRPLERGIVDQANIYDTQSRRDAEAGKAVADVGQQVDAARVEQSRNLERMGVDPSSGRALALQGTMGLGEAAAKAGAAQKARTQVETTGFARKMDAASLGRGLASSQSTAAGLALTSGNSSVASGTTPLAIASQGAGLMQTGFNTAISANNSAGQLYGQQAQIHNTADANSNAWMNAAGTVAGMAISDKNAKKGIHPVNDDEALESVPDNEALEQVASTPVATWSYKDSSAAADGGQKHIGPMAQDVRKTMGDKIAPGGKKIDLISLNGKNMAAIGALKRQFDSLDSKVTSIAAMVGANVHQQRGNTAVA
jgi:Chaperone of endosialidase